MNYEFVCSTKQVKATEKQIILHSPFSILNLGIGRELVKAVVNPIEPTNNYALCIMNYEFDCSTKQVKAAEKQIILHSPFSILNLGFGREPVKAVVNPIEPTNNYALCIMNYEFDCSTKQVKAAEKQIILHSPFSILNLGFGREPVKAVVNPIEPTNNYALCIMNYEFDCSTKQVKAAEKQIILHSPFSILNLGFGREPVKAVVNPIEQTNNYALCIMNYEFDCSTKQVKATEKQIILHSPFSILHSQFRHWQRVG